MQKTRQKTCWKLISESFQLNWEFGKTESPNKKKENPGNLDSGEDYRENNPQKHASLTVGPTLSPTAIGILTVPF